MSQISAPKVNTEPTRVSKSLHFCETGKASSLKTVKRLYRADDACCAIDFWLRCQFPFLNSVIPKYLKESTNSISVLYMKVGPSAFFEDHSFVDRKSVV